MVLVSGLAAWRLAAMLSYEDGPFDVFARLRRAVGISDEPGAIIEGFLPLLFSCVWCIGWWCALLFVVLSLFAPFVTHVFAAAAVVVMVERWNRG